MKMLRYHEKQIVKKSTINYGMSNQSPLYVCLPWVPSLKTKYFSIRSKQDSIEIKLLKIDRMYTNDITK